MLQVQDLVVGYTNEVDILKGISIKADDNKITAVIGPNGAGKSTLLKAIYGFLKPRKGSIVYKGEDIQGRQPHELLRAGIAFLPQSSGIFPLLTVEQNLMLGAWIYRQDKAKVRQQCELLLEKYPNLKSKRKTPAGSLSGGEQKMLEIAKTLVVDPQLILADEPTAGLASKFYRDVYSELDALRRTKNRTIILVDQNSRQAARISDYVYVIEEGKNSVEGPQEEFDSGALGEIVQSWLA